MMRCAPLISIAAQSPLMELILPPEMRQQTGAVQVVQGARWMTSEQGQRIPAQVGRAFGPGLPRVEKPCPVIEEKLPSVSGDA